MEVVAHRGYGDRYPENTVLAARRAAETAEWLEIDVRRCRSGELVVFHDATLDRLTGASGYVTGIDWSDLRDLEVLDSGEGVPLLAELLDAVPADTGVLIELKQRGVGREVAEIAGGRENPIGICSFELRSLQEVRNAGSELPLAYIMDDPIYGPDPGLGVEVAALIGSRYLHPSPPFCTPGFVDAAHERGIEVHAGTLASATHSPDDVERLRERGVDRIVVDDPEIAGR